MKVVIVGPVYPYRGGIAHYTTLLAKAFIKAHPDQVKVVSFQRQYPKFLYPGRSDKDPSQEVLRVEAEYLLDPIYPWRWWLTYKYISNFKPELVILQWWTTFWAPAFAILAYLLRRRGVFIIYLIHNVLPHETRWWDPYLTRFALRQGDKHIVQTESQKELFTQMLPNIKPETHPHPVYDMFSNKRIPKSQARQILRLQEDQIVLLFFGIVRPYKGLEQILTALAQLRSQGKNTFLLTAGEIWQDKQAIDSQIENLDLWDYVRIEDRYIPNEEIHLYFSAADILLAPYKNGTQSGAVKMALGFGLPVIASTKIADESMQERENEGIFVISPGEPNELAKIIDLATEYLKTSSKEKQDQIYKNAGDPTPRSEDWERLVSLIERMTPSSGDKNQQHPTNPKKRP